MGWAVGPGFQEDWVTESSHPLLWVDPLRVFALVASQRCPWRRLWHVADECPGDNLYPWDQQYPLGSNVRDREGLWVDDDLLC